MLINLGDIMGLFSFLLGLDEERRENEKQEKEKRIEQEMAWHNLDDYEKEEVRNGNYDVYNFEDSVDEDLDEDDYYKDDDR